MNTIWLIIAGLIIVVAAAIILLLLPQLRKTHPDTLLTGSRAPAVVGGIAVLLFAIAIYFALSKPPTTVPTQEQIAQNGQMAPEHIEMIKGLKEKLEQNPNDGKGWSMLARSYAVLGRYDESAAAYEKAVNLIPNNAALMVNYADVLAMANGKNLQGKPLDLLQNALKIDPNNIKGLLLIGKAAYQAGHFTQAADYWEQLLRLLPPNTPLAKQISDNIAKAREQAKSKQ